VLKAGVLDSHDVESDQKFNAELFTGRRPPWVKQQDGVDQVDGTL